ncbi:MAG: hypothetical protein JWO67_3178 [Streptosporangiaceae bacterium]|nr:hypothetical protein [Streptosporangiaceae bacterium]
MSPIHTDERTRDAVVSLAQDESVDTAGRRAVVALAVFMVACVAALGWAFFESRATVDQQKGDLDSLQGTLSSVRVQQNDAAQKSQVLADQVKSLGRVPAVSPAMPIRAPAPADGRNGADGAPGAAGVAGRGIVSTAMRGGHLVVQLSDGTTNDVGQVAGGSGLAGASGVSIVSSSLFGGHLVLAYSDGHSSDVGQVVGQPGKDGLAGPPGRSVRSAGNASGHLVITYSDGTSDDLGPIPGGKEGAPGSPPADFTFSVDGGPLAGPQAFTCTPDPPGAVPGSTPHYGCHPTK